MTTRGIRNFNPGNIDRHDNVKWQGMAADQSGDPRFVVFTDPKWGIRAIARLMLTYSSQYGLKTVRGLIGRWAPPSENNTGAYVAAVASAVGVGADDQIDVDSAAVMAPLVKAIILHENGSNPYSEAQISEGIRLAGVVDAKPPAATKAPPVQAQAGAVGLGATAFVLDKVNSAASWAPEVKKAAAGLSDYAGVPIMDHAITIIGTVAGGLALLGLALTVLHLRKA